MPASASPRSRTRTGEHFRRPSCPGLSQPGGQFGYTDAAANPIRPLPHMPRRCRSRFRLPFEARASDHRQAMCPSVRERCLCSAPLSRHPCTRRCRMAVRRARFGPLSQSLLTTLRRTGREYPGSGCLGQGDVCRAAAEARSRPPRRRGRPVYRRGSFGLQPPRKHDPHRTCRQPPRARD
jgi:hypothetical protein